MTDAAQRLLLILIAATLTGIVVILLCGALVLGLAHYMPIWAALVVTAVVLLVLALMVLTLATRSRPATQKSSTAAQRPSGNTDTAHLASLLDDSMKKSPKTTMGFALIAGIALGADPSLRKDILNLLARDQSPSGEE